MRFSFKIEIFPTAQEKKIRAHSHSFTATFLEFIETEN